MSDTAVYFGIYKGYTINIEHDDDPTNPREWDNVSVFALSAKSYILSNEANVPFNQLDSWPEVESYINSMYNVFYIKPVYAYIHSGIVLSLEPFNDRFDSGQVGYIFITREVMKREFGLRKRTPNNLAKAKRIIEGELETYNKYLSGDVYEYTIEKPSRKVPGSSETVYRCSNFYSLSETIDDAKSIIDGIYRNKLSEHIKYLKSVIKRRVPLIYRKPLVLP